jgi:dCMP deaminase
MQRPSFNETFLNTCFIWSERSSCQKLQTATVIVKNNNIISIGYNGVPSKKKHCTDYWREFFYHAKFKNQLNTNNEYNLFCKEIISELKYNDNLISNISTYDEFIQSELFKVLHHYWSDKNELHAELNALLQAETSVKDAELYTLYSPCRQCAKSIISAKISKVYYRNEYQNDKEGLLLLERSDIEVKKI